ncbi:MAG: ribonuclease domain-containing protein [Chloroflexota bacterium]|nr:ribonuclease domain-containing protein [Chloroflexota bacterium]
MSPTPASTPTGQPAPSATRPPSTPTRPAGMAIPTPLPGERLPTISFDRLPPEARDIIRLIARGRPFPYRQDGVVFENRERLLPSKSSGYYHEYTVETPGSPDRGARRIITGGQGELYYTDDHYASFKRVVP